MPAIPPGPPAPEPGAASQGQPDSPSADRISILPLSGVPAPDTPSVSGSPVVFLFQAHGTRHGHRKPHTLLPDTYELPPHPAAKHTYILIIAPNFQNFQVVIFAKKIHAPSYKNTATPFGWQFYIRMRSGSHNAGARNRSAGNRPWSESPASADRTMATDAPQ